MEQVASPFDPELQTLPAIPSHPHAVALGGPCTGSSPVESAVSPAGSSAPLGVARQALSRQRQLSDPVLGTLSS